MSVERALAVPEDADQVLERWWTAARAHPRLADLVALVPGDRQLGIADGIVLLPVVMTMLGDPGERLGLLGAIADAYATATGQELRPRSLESSP